MVSAGKTFGTSKANSERLHSAQLCRVFELHAIQHQYLIWLELCQKYHWKATDSALFFIISYFTQEKLHNEDKHLRESFRNISVLGNPKQMYLLFSLAPAICSAFFHLFLWVFVLLDCFLTIAVCWVEVREGSFIKTFRPLFYIKH